MPVQVTTLFKKSIDKWKSFTKSQQIRIAVIAGLVILSLAATVFLYTRPQYVSFVSNKDAATIGAIRDLFDSNAIKYKIEDNTTSIYVLASQMDAANLAYAANPDIVGKDFDLDAAMNLMGMGTTQSQNKLVEQQLANSEVKRLVESINGVTKANVMITPQNDTSRLFPSQVPVTASIVIESDGSVTKATGKMIQQIAANAIQGLAPENVHVSDQNGTIAGSSQDGFADSSERQQNEEAKKRTVATQVESLLAGNYDIVVAEPFLFINWDSAESTKSTVSSPIEGSKTGVPIQQSAKDSSVTEGTAGDLVGLEANDLEATPTYPNGSGSTANAESSESTVTYDYDRETTSMVTAPGTVDLARSSIAVMVYSNKTYYESDVEDKGLLTDKSWQDYQDEINRAKPQFEVDESFYSLVSNSTGIDRNRITILHYENPIFVNKVVEPINFGAYASIGTLIALLALLALSLIQKTKPEEIAEVEPELSVEELLVSTQQEPDKQSVAEIDIQDDSELKKQIDKFVDEKPEAVAQLLRNWLSDEWE